MTSIRLATTRTGSIAAGLVAVVLIGASCGSGTAAGTTTTEPTTTGTETTTTTTTTTTSTTSESPTSTAAADEVTVQVFFSSGDGSDCSSVEPLGRTVDTDADPIAAAFDALVLGPTADEADAGVSSFFSAATADAVSSVALNEELLIVDFVDLRPLLNNASTSCGSQALLSQLNSTAFQFVSVDRVRYLMDGSCALFANWLQRECFETDRDGNQLDLSTNDQAEGSGCVPASSGDLSDGRWFGYVQNSQVNNLEFDLACWFTGTAAAAAASEDGEESPPPNDYYVRNQNDQLRTVPVDPTAEVAWLPEPGDPTSVEVVSYDKWLAEQAGRVLPPGVWLTIEDGQVTAIEEQYVP